MYCPKCNLHSEEYVDKCPLCDGPMEIDEVASGVMKTPTVPDKERTEDLPGDESLGGAEKEEQEDAAMDATVTLEADQARILAEVEQERAQLETSQEKEEPAEASPPPPTQEEEQSIEKEKLSFEDASPPPPEPSGRKKGPLFLGGGVLLILILALLAYFLLSPTEKPSKPGKTKVAVAEKKAKHEKPRKTRKKVAAKKRKEKKAAAKMKKQKKAAAQAPAEKAALAVAAKTDAGSATKKDEPAQSMTEKEALTAPASKPETLPAEPTVAQAETVDKAPAPSRPAGALGSQEKLAARPAPLSTSLPTAHEKGSFSIHVGSFRSEKNASALRDQLKEKGYPAFCRAVKLPEKGDWYRVQIGYFASREDVNQVESHLKKEEKIYTRILKRK